MPEKMFNSSVDYLLKKQGLSKQIVKKKKVGADTVEKKAGLTSIQINANIQGQGQNIMDQLQPLTSLYSSEEEDESYNPNELTLYGNDDYGSYRPLKVDKMEVDINN